MHRTMKPSPASLRRFLPFLLWWPRVTRGTLRADEVHPVQGGYWLLRAG